MNPTTDDDLVALRNGLAANAAHVHGPMDLDAASEWLAGLLSEIEGTVGAAADPIVDRVVAAATVRDPRLTDRFVRPTDDGFRTRAREFCVGITGSLIASADPATVAVAFGPGTPREIALLPPVHVCLVPTDLVRPRFTDAVASLDTSQLPSALTWIAGPSRTGDLEMIRTLGVHGPLRVEYLLVAPH